MAQEELTSEVMAAEAADWVSTILSIPLIWPKATLLTAFGATAASVLLIIFQSTRPAIAPPPPLDRARIAEIERHLQLADEAIRGKMTVPVPESACNYHGYLHAVGDPDHAERNHDPSRVQSH